MALGREVLYDAVGHPTVRPGVRECADPGRMNGSHAREHGRVCPADQADMPAVRLREPCAGLPFLALAEVEDEAELRTRLIGNTELHRSPGLAVFPGPTGDGERARTGIEERALDSDLAFRQPLNGST
jgi:hypothetical protein